MLLGAVALLGLECRFSHICREAPSARCQDGRAAADLTQD
jgi:hypothetical protein